MLAALLALGILSARSKSIASRGESAATDIRAGAQRGTPEGATQAAAQEQAPQGVSTTQTQKQSSPEQATQRQPLAERRAVSEQRIAAAREPKLSRAQVAALLRRKIRYVFVLYQENRSFDSYFGTFPSAEGIFSHPAKDTPGFYQPLTNSFVIPAPATSTERRA